MGQNFRRDPICDRNSQWITSSSSITLCISDNSLPFSPVELSLIIAETETSENVAGDETDIERISPTIHRTEVRIVSTPPHSWVRSSNLSSRVYVSIFLRKKGRRKVILHGGSTSSIISITNNLLIIGMSNSFFLFFSSPLTFSF